MFAPFRRRGPAQQGIDSREAGLPWRHRGRLRPPGVFPGPPGPVAPGGLDPMPRDSLAFPPRPWRLDRDGKASDPEKSPGAAARGCRAHDSIPRSSRWRT